MDGIKMTTQYANATYQEIIDLHTEENTVSVIGIHTPSTSLPTRMLSGFWRQFNKFRYNGCSFSMVPAARLPTDPLHIDANPGSAADIMDPRDNLNPVLFHGCHGNDMGRILNQFYETGSMALDSGNADNAPFSADTVNAGYKGKVKRGSNQNDIEVIQSTSLEQNIQTTNRVGDVQLESLYYRALTDSTWKKSGPQSGLKIRGLHPLVYNVATTRSLGVSGVAVSSNQVQPQIGLNTGAARTYSTGSSNVSPATGSAGTESWASEYGMGQYELGAHQVQGPQTTTAGGNIEYWPVSDTPLYTSRTMRLGWMDTRLRDENGSYSITGLDGNFVNDSQKISQYFRADRENYATCPKIYMGMLILPRAYRTEQYFRCVLTHSFSFKGFRGQSFTTEHIGDVTSAPGYWNFN